MLRLFLLACFLLRGEAGLLGDLGQTLGFGLLLFGLGGETRDLGLASLLGFFLDGLSVRFGLRLGLQAGPFCSLGARLHHEPTAGAEQGNGDEGDDEFEV